MVVIQKSTEISMDKPDTVWWLVTVLNGMTPQVISMHKTEDDARWNAQNYLIQRKAYP